MDYELKLNDVFEFEDNDYLVLDMTTYKDELYIFTNKLISEEEPGKEFVVFKALEEGLLIEEDTTVLNEVNKTFSANFNKKLATIAHSVEE